MEHFRRLKAFHGAHIYATMTNSSDRSHDGQKQRPPPLLSISTNCAILETITKPSFSFFRGFDGFDGLRKISLTGIAYGDISDGDSLCQFRDADVSLIMRQATNINMGNCNRVVGRAFTSDRINHICTR
jgi:hypothetical protein